ncbi:MAG TPA: YMGG-like glycine zipper-containing protein [Pyrinomonadaceae bacterium]|nr:YMGG-like glycine zipper-containing protein [Pyrinomonadaceae bacterium]
MNRIRQAISVGLVLALVSLGLTATAEAQRRPYRLSYSQVDDLIRRVEMSTDRFRASLESALDRGRYAGSGPEDNITQYVRSFEQATDRLRDRFNNRSSAAADVEFVLQQAVAINQFMLTNRVSQRAQSDWQIVRSDLDALARAYEVNWNWNQATPVTGGGVSGFPHRVNDQQVGIIIGRIETRTDSFRDAVDRALDRSTYNNTRAEDNIKQFIQNFEQATDQLRSRFGSRNAAASDVENVLRQASYIDSFMRRNQLSRRSANEWDMLRTDLNELAAAYNVAWNWSGTTLPAPGDTTAGTSTSLTGTYRIDPTRSDNIVAVADRATLNLPSNERDSVRQDLVRRLEAPEMIAIERNGNNVGIASSRAPRANLVADGREITDRLPNGGVARISTQIVGERLTIRSSGDRATDFNVSFEPINGGRQMRVTRELWNERLGANPVVVQNIYDRTADVAQWTVFTGTPAPGQPGSTQTGSTTQPAGDFIVANNQILVATLNQNLTTQNSQVGDRFTMTVREPAQFEGATIEGRVASVNRSGRIKGRADMSLDFDSIRLRDGRTYQFAGFIESVRTADGQTVQIDNEGGVREDDSRGETTAQRAAIGTAVGAIIGAIAGGGKGAVIGAVVGAGAGAGSVYVQGRDDLELASGTEMTIRASAPNR